MIVQKLTLINFKNHTERSFDFSPQINCFVGNNGVGKTNILDALHYLSMGKSFLGNSDLQNIQLKSQESRAKSQDVSEDFFVIDAEIKNEGKDDVIRISQPKNSKKIIKKNNKTYDRLADHIGYLPSVMISPYDSNLISDSGESRRKFLDSMISQTDFDYLFTLIQYQKTIQQRNALLKYFFKNRTFDKDSLEIYDEPISKFGAKIFEKRTDFVTQLNPIVQKYYEIISGGKEKVSVIYQSHLLDEILQQAEYDQNTNLGLPKIQQIFEDLLKNNISKDRQLTYTSSGVHKDDLAFEMNGKLIKKIGSQGQQKSFLVSLKLAQMNLIKSMTNKTPILLLDDIFDKLDDNRVSHLIELVNQENFGQIFITDTHKERTESVVKRINEDSKIFEI